MNTSRNNLSSCSLASLLADRRGGEYEEQEGQKNGMGAVARLLWEPISGVGGRRPPSEMLDFCVSCVGQRRWASEQSLAQFGILVDVPCYDGANGRRVAVIASLTAACEASIQAKADATLVPGDEQLTRGQPPGTSLSRYAAFASTASRLNDIGKYSWSAQLCARLP